jgi:phosphate-transporting ATPase
MHHISRGRLWRERSAGEIIADQSFFTTIMLIVRNLVRISLFPVSFNLPDGECTAVQGPSGSGKSLLLLRAIADLNSSRSEIMLDGRSREAIPAPQ